MQTSKSPLIHIGYHKTASSWLQANLFDDYGFEKYFSQSEIMKRIVLPNALDFNADELRAYYDSVVGADDVSVISNERLSGNPHSGGYDSKEIADRLYASFPEAKVLIVIREQVSAILSSYIQYIRVGGPCSIDDYLNPPKRSLSVLPLFDFEHFNYLRLVRYYYELFGPERVLVLPFEKFKESPVDFCSKVTSFVDLPEPQLADVKVANKRISTLSSMFLRQSNKLFAKSRLNPAAFGKKQNRLMTGSGEGGSYQKILAMDALIPKSVHKFFDKRLREIIEAKVGDRYKEANEELTELTEPEMFRDGKQVKSSEHQLEPRKHHDERNEVVGASSRATLVHVGYHKTATTWLQHNLLNNPELGFKRYISKDEIRDKIIVPNALDFDAPKLRAWYESVVDDAYLSVVSSERISGHPHSGGFDSKQNADRIKAVFPDAKILIVQREPVDAILSSYLQYVKTGGVCNLDDYIQPPARNLPILTAFDFEYFNYAKLVGYYNDLFDDVLVLHYEDFIQDPKSFCLKITNFAGAKSLEELPFNKVRNKGLSFMSCFWLRQFNKLLSKTRLNPAGLGLNALQKQIARLLIALDGLFPKSWNKAFKQSMKDYIRAKAEFD
ncbi:MAG: hypothetical protein HOA17_05750 [Candidatus Melainabacteria bacterium]|jgi:hypothetical protein|nr:hypothetical protein [Candidatus Melainabacteria bacterium]